MPLAWEPKDRPGLQALKQLGLEMPGDRSAGTDFDVVRARNARDRPDGRRFAKSFRFPR